MKKSYYCEKLEKSLHFLPDKVNFCCTCAEGAGVKINDFSNFNMKNIIEQRNKYVRQLRNGNIPKECSGCSDYKEMSFKEKIKSYFNKHNKNKISHIIIDHYTQCDCRCIYCSKMYYYDDKTQKYELLPIIKQLYKNKMIDDENLKAEFQGGNVSCLNEFESLVNEFYSHNCKEFVILTNGIKYIPILEKINVNSDSRVVISIDSGSSETFNRIKQVDAFNNVLENIKTLKRNSGFSVWLKYIIVKNINDNMEETEKFLNTVKELGNIDLIILEMDYNDTFMSKGTRIDVPAHYYKLVEYAENYCKENNINFTIYPYTKSVLDRGYSI